MIVVPQSWHPTLRGWGPGVGHFYYDLWKSAEERYGFENVCWVAIEPEKLEWSKDLRKEIQRIKPSHIMMHIEEFPNGDLMSLLEFASSLPLIFQGWVTLLMYDSIYWNHLFAAELICDLYPKTAIIATDQFPAIARVPNKVGPALLPTSLASISALESSYKETQNPENKYGLTLIGQVYGYRAKALEKMAKHGLVVEVNPHRLNTSNRNLDYSSFYAAFRDSWATINFSRANGALVKHAKTRILEATLFGAVLVTDEYPLTSQLLGKGAFVYFKNPEDLKRKIARLKEYPEEYLEIKRLGNEGAEKLRTVFWVEWDKLRNGFERSP
jgi:glycosyltransferase involved in cell wall biosynthesis